MRRFFYLFFKRLSDILLSLIGFAVFLAPMLIIAVLVKLTSRGPIIFRQKRVGKNKKLFTIYKFRTMRKNTPKDVPTRNLENPNGHITPLGRLLRKTSLDELPQLFNILFGKMSVVGPRPVIYTEQDQVDEREKYNANRIRPGLTGLAQINGRDGLNIYDKARFDGEYVKKMSLWLDFKIIVITFFKVLRGRGVREGKANPAQAEPVQDTAAPETNVGGDPLGAPQKEPDPKTENADGDDKVRI